MNNYDRNQDSSRANNATSKKELLDVGKNVGFIVLSIIGWLAYIPLAIFGLIAFFVVYIVFAYSVGIIVRFLGIDAVEMTAGTIVCMAGLTVMLLNAIGFAVAFDRNTFNPWNIPGILISGIFNLIRPNRLTFFLGCAASAYIVVMELPRLFAG